MPVHAVHVKPHQAIVFMSREMPESVRNCSLQPASSECIELHLWSMVAALQQPGSSEAGRSSGAVRAQGGKILACAACEDSQSVASASSSGSVHVWRVEYTSRSGGAPDRYTGIIGDFSEYHSLCRMCLTCASVHHAPDACVLKICSCVYMHPQIRPCSQGAP